MKSVGSVNLTIPYWTLFWASSCLHNQFHNYLF